MLLLNFQINASITNNLNYVIYLGLKTVFVVFNGIDIA